MSEPTREELHAVAEHKALVTGECFYCENTEAVWDLLPREAKALRLRCQGCGFIVEADRE